MGPAPVCLNPFPGLRPFTQDEDYLFFGREEQTMELLQRLGGNRFLAVVGTSGSGKSSLVRCGLLSTGNPVEATEAFRKTLDISQKLVDANPARNDFRQILSYSHNNLGRAYARLQRFAEAFIELDKAVAIKEKLAAEDPATAQYSLDVAFSRSIRGGGTRSHSSVKSLIKRNIFNG